MRNQSKCERSHQLKLFHSWYKVSLNPQGSVDHERAKDTLKHLPFGYASSSFLDSRLRGLIICSIQKNWVGLSTECLILEKTDSDSSIIFEVTTECDTLEEYECVTVVVSADKLLYH